MQLVNDANEVPLPPINCTVCGSALYATDWGSFEVTYHCSSAEARFWDFDRGTPDQNKAKEHWDKSRQEVLLDRNEEKKLDQTG
jgi:hypothetical protein